MADNALIVKETFGGRETASQTELTATAGAAAARAEVEARIIAARRWPRDEDTFRVKIMDLCRIPDFADSCLYDRPVGREKGPDGEWRDKHVIDWNIRALESFIQMWGNVHIYSHVIADTETSLQIRVGVVDLQSMVAYEEDALINKTVERKGDQRDKRGTPVSQRQNSLGEMVYRYLATPEEIRSKAGIERSKLIRDQGKRILPRWVMAEARATVDRVIADETAKDPTAAKKKVLDGFSSIGITPDMLKAYLNRTSLDGLTVKDIAELKVIYSTLSSGDITWADLIRIKDAAPDDPGPVVPAETGKGKEKLKDRIARAREAATAKQEKPPEKQES